jgi:tryptophan synthase alpha chain
MNGNRIARALEKLRTNGQRAFIPYVAAGDPTLDVTERLVLAFAAAGVDVVELGVPFSDPIADGPSIQRATERALRGGVALPAVLACVERIRRSSDIPIALMGYYNPFHRYGVEAFCKAAAQAGVDGLIVPDLPPEDAEELIPAARAQDIATVFLAAPTSTDARIRRIAEASTGFVYCVSLTGVTGARDAISQDLEPLLRRLRTVTAKPVCAGFGIGTAEQARAVAALADGVIVGSAVVNVIEAHVERPDRIVPAAEAFVRELVLAVRSVA